MNILYNEYNYLFMLELSQSILVKGAPEGMS